MLQGLNGDEIQNRNFAILRGTNLYTLPFTMSQGKSIALLLALIFLCYYLLSVFDIVPCQNLTGFPVIF